MQVDTWVPFARQLEETNEGVSYYELPVIQRMNMLARTFINEGMRAGIPDQVARERTIALALYATLESADDIDYYTFEGKRGQEILLELTIPQIEGQAEFAPNMALMGPGLPSDELPEGVIRPEEAGVLVILPPPGPAPTFFEPFSRTSYWERQEQRIRLPSDGRFVAAVWHPDGQVGRYTFVIGDKERPGGDPAFPLKMRRFWTPVPTLEPTPPPASVVDQGHTGEWCQ